jgi:hypothetical protein
MGNEPMPRIAVILIALDEDLSILDDQNSGDALTREKIVDRQRPVLEAILDARSAAGGNERKRTGSLLEDVVRQQPVELAE